MKQNFQTGIAVFVCFTFILIGCGGRAASPVTIFQYGDQGKSCKALQEEMDYNQQEISRILPDTEKNNKNTMLGIAGFFLIVPWLYMDFTESERIEVTAYRERYNHLALIAKDKKCGYATKSIPAIQNR
jgi:hypothetical protein